MTSATYPGRALGYQQFAAEAILNVLYYGGV